MQLTHVFVAVTYAVSAASLCAAAAPALSAPMHAGGQVEFTLTGESNIQYRIQASTNLQTWFPVATNLDVGANRQITVPEFGSHCVYRAEARVPRFKFAIAALDTITLTGNDIVIDSFDSQDPVWSTQGRYDLLKRTDHAVLGAPNGDLGNAGIYGRLSVTTNGHFDIGPNGKVGDLAWHADPTSAGFQPGSITDDLDPVVPPVVVPYTVGFLPPAGFYNGRLYPYVLGNNNYLVEILNLNGQAMAVIGNAALMVSSNLMMQGLSRIDIAPGASLQLYVAGPTAFIGGNGVANTNRASAFVYYGLPSNTNVTISLSGLLTGCIYAPNAHVTVTAGTNRLAFAGSIIARSVSFTGHVELHYDQALQRTGPFTW